MTDGKKLNMSGIGKGIVFSLVMTFIFVPIIAAVCYFCEISDRLLGLMVLAASGISVFVGAVIAAKVSKVAGIWHGAILGMGYFLILILSNTISNHGFNPDSQMITKIICVIACGMLGGIVGITKK